MKRFVVYFALLLPGIILVLAKLFPQADPAWAAPLFHFYIVTFTTFAATVLSLFVAISVGGTALPRHLFLAIAFAWMGAVFFIHGITTSGAIMEGFNPAIVWSAWFTVFGGGVLFLAGSFAPNEPNPRLLRGLALVTLIGYLIYASIAAFGTAFLSQLLLLRTPRVDLIVFSLTLLIWAVSSAKHYLNYRRSKNSFDGLMAFESVWFGCVTISMFRYAVWNASWWLYHALLLGGFLIAIYFLWRGYEQIRAFRLSRYFAAASLIVTVALALLSAQFYAELAYNNLTSQLEEDAGASSQSLAAALATALPEMQTADDLRNPPNGEDVRAAIGGTMKDLRLQAAILYNADGISVFGTALEGAGAKPSGGPVDPGALKYGDSSPSVTVAEPQWLGLNLHSDPGDFAEFQESLASATVFGIAAPDDPPSTYQPATPVHIVETYAPFYPGGDTQAAPIGVLVTLREAPGLAQAITLSRRSGIGLAALSLGGLFLALLVIVRRADQIISSRTRELERAYTNLREAEGLRDDLTNMIVHDLRNPLTAITANLDLITKTSNDPAYASAAPRFLASARAAGQRMMGMIDDLLNVGKFEAGELRPGTAPLYLPTLLVEKESVYRLQAERDQKTITIQAPPELPTIRGDAELISRVIDNLVSNALKYTSSGGHIDIKVEQKDHALLVQVRDDGQGIPPEYHQRIFDKFVQVTDAQGRSLRQGTGLGLAFCRLAVEAHKGKIWVESVEGQGSAFMFTLPMR
jgi:signal transduction histidine kinase